MLNLYLMVRTQTLDVAHGLVVWVVVRSLNKRVELALEWTISRKMVALANEALKLPSHGSITRLGGIPICSLLGRKLLCNVVAIVGRAISSM